MPNERPCTHQHTVFAGLAATATCIYATQKLLYEPVHVLVVDGAGADRDRVSRCIAELGFRCEAVASAADALDVLDWWRPIVVIIGSQDGVRELRAWAADQYRPLLVILHAEREDASADYDEYIQKPASPPLLEAAILKFLSD